MSAWIKLKLHSENSKTNAVIDIQGEEEDLVTLLAVTFGNDPSFIAITEAALIVSRTSMMQELLEHHSTTTDFTKEVSATHQGDIT